MADSIDSPLMNISPLQVERVGETKRKGESQNQKRSFPRLEKTGSDGEKDGDQTRPDMDTYEKEGRTEAGKEWKKPEVQSEKKVDKPDGMGLIIDITV